MRAPDQLVPLAVVVKSHGVRGELRVKLFNPDSELLVDCERIVLRDKLGAVAERQVESVRPGGPGFLNVALVGCDDRDAADALRGAELCVHRKDLPELPEGELYHVDFEGLEAVLPDGAVVGRIERVIDYPAASCLLLRSSQGDREVPMREPYFVAVDLEAGRVVVSSLDDLDLAPPRDPRR